MRFALVLSLLLPLLAHAGDAAVAKKPEVYKWVDSKGVVHYTDKPPSQDAKPVALPPLQTYKRGTVPDINKFTPPGSSGNPISSVGPQIQVVTPSREETFRGGERTVPVAVMVTPSLDPEQKLVYLLDGKPMGQPTGDTSFALTGVERGAHTVTVNVVDGNGQEISRSTPVTFYMKPPQVRR